LATLSARLRVKRFPSIHLPSGINQRSMRRHPSVSRFLKRESIGSLAERELSVTRISGEVMLTRGVGGTWSLGGGGSVHRTTSV
jgi:hypothetical protein